MKVQKTTFLFLLAIIVGVSVMAQSPQQFAYQAVLRGDSGEPIASEDITVNVDILQGGTDGTVVFSETHQTATNAFGLFTLHIGSVETMAGIDWADGPYFLEVRHGDETLGSSELLSVPYALFSLISGDAFSGDYHDLENLPDLDAYISIADPQPGDMIYFNQGAWHALPIGQEDQVLIMSESLPQWGNTEDIIPIRYRIDLESDPVGAARLVGSGAYEPGTDIIIRAFSRDGFVFVNWTDEDGQEVSDEDTFTITVAEEDITITGHFDLILFNLSVDVIPSVGGSVDGIGEYPLGAEVILTAEPAEDFSFVRWTDEEDEELGTAGTLTVTMPLHDLHLKAYFELSDPDLYMVDVISQPEGAGNIVGAGSYAEEDKVTLHALPSEGYRFVKWTDQAGQELDIFSPMEMEMPANNLTFIAHYEEAVTVTDYDGNIYSTVVIGEQRWMAENLRTTHYQDGSEIPFYPEDWNNLSSGAYVVMPHNIVEGVDSEEDMMLRYGALYNWFAGTDERGLCPEGWHVPASEDFDQLVTYLQETYGLSNESEELHSVGNALKQARQVDHPWGGPHQSELHPRWNEDDESGIHYGMDLFGFNATAAGMRMFIGQTFVPPGLVGGMWSASGAPPFQNQRMFVEAGFGHAHVGTFNGNTGMSVRCVQDVEDPHYSVMVAVEPAEGGSVRGQGYYSEGSEVSLQAVPADGYVFDEWVDGDGEPITHLPNYSFTMPGENVSLTATFSERVSHMIPGEGVTDIDGNHYATVIIGNQEWMAENLKTTHYDDGTEIPFNPDNWTALTSGAYTIMPYNLIDGIDSEEEMVLYYGRLYNWYAAMDDRGLCPEGWHVPTGSEWAEMLSYLSDEYGLPIEDSDEVYGVGNALRLAKQEGHPWGGPYDSPVHPRWNPSDNHYGMDLFGFGAVPGGQRGFGGNFANHSNYGYYWHGSGAPPMTQFQVFGYDRSGTNVGTFFAYVGNSVRCIRIVEE